MAKASQAKTKGKLSKKQLKQDKLVEFAYKAERYYLEHQKILLSIVTGVVVVVIVGVLIGRSMQGSRLEDSYQLTLAKMQYGAGRMDEARAAFQQVLTTRGRAVAGEAKYFLGRIALEQGDFAQAEADFGSYVKDYSVDDFLDAAAVSGLAAALESQGRLEEAAQAYLQAANEHPAVPAAPQNLIEASRIYMTIDQKDKAIHILKQIRERFPESALAPQAKRQLDELE